MVGLFEEIRRMRLSVPLIAVALLAGGSGAVLAQTPSGAPQGATPPAASPAPAQAPTATTPTAPQGTSGATPHPHRRKLEDRFREANTTHDGRLTLGQAQAAHWKRVVENFQAIDREHKGYVTVDDIHAFNKARRAHHHAAPQPESSKPEAPTSK
jgi:hypothetical protein